ncbi:MAG: ATP-binding protein [Thermodesulfobacteriota bacterium]
MTISRKSRILVIDDNQDICNDIRKILLPSVNSSELDALVGDITGSSGPETVQPKIQIDSALQGDEGVAMVRQARLEGNPYALAFVDIRIPPGLDGVETIKQLQEEDEDLQYIIITAYSDYSWQDINTEISPKDNLLILKKPFESIEIHQSVSTLVEKWHLAHEREEALEALIHIKKMETVGVMASGITHDFNNLLMAILGNIELAVMKLPEEHASCAFLQKAKDSINEAKEVTDKLLLFSSFNFSRRQPISIRGLVMETSNFALAESNVNCMFSLPDDLWQPQGDFAQLNHALCEIFKNAKEAMADEGKVAVRVKNIKYDAGEHADKREGKYVRILIQDDGCGIKEKDLSHIFEPYYSGKKRSVVKGMGLGLAIVAAVVSQHEGYVHVESTPGVGTTVCLELPVADTR